MSHMTTLRATYAIVRQWRRAVTHALRARRVTGMDESAQMKIAFHGARTSAGAARKTSISYCARKLAPAVHEGFYTGDFYIARTAPTHRPEKLV